MSKSNNRHKINKIKTNNRIGTNREVIKTV